MHLSRRTLALLTTSLAEPIAPPAVGEGGALPLCFGCAHLQGSNEDGTARCSAFDRIPATVWNGQVDHRTAMRGDRGVRFTAMGGYGQAIEAEWARTQLLRRGVIAAGDEPETDATATEVIEADPDNRPERRDLADEQAPGAPPETFHVVAVVEGAPTGDRRLFETGAGYWAELPLEFGWARKDLPAHEEAEVVGSITRARREGDTIHFWGHHDADGELGAEWMRQCEALGRRPVSMVLDDVDVEVDWPDDTGDEPMMLEPDLVRYTRYRIRRVDQVITAAFTETFVETAAAEEQPDPAEDGAAEPAVVAAAIPLAPPLAWLRDPQLPGPTAWTVEDSGRCYGHLSIDGQCHTSFLNECVIPPYEESMDYFTTGELVTAEGVRVAVGQVTLGTGHADIHLRHLPAVEHYDNTGAAVADVACGRDRFGIWVAGALRPGVTAMQVRALRAATLSGDWRKIRTQHGGRDFRLVAALAVNVPGFPVPRTRARVASGGPLALVAAGVLNCRPCAQRRRVDPHLDAAAERVAASIGRGRADRLAELDRRVHG